MIPNAPKDRHAFEPLCTASRQLANCAVMARMTRSRDVDANAPNALMLEYCSALRDVTT